MSDWLVLTHTAIAITAIVLLILKIRVSPVIALAAGAIYLGLASGLGAQRTMHTLTTGFGDLMAETGLLIAVGVLLGSVLSAMGTIRKLVDLLLRAFGTKRIPYPFGVVLGTLLQSIFGDVLLVITAPIARSVGRRIEPHGPARMAAATALGIEVGIALVVPGVGALALAGLLSIPLGTMLLYGALVAAVSIVAALAFFSFLARRGFWNPETDEVTDDEPVADEPEQLPALRWSLTPLLVSLALIAGGGIAQAAGIHSGSIDLLGDPVAALLIGLVGATVVARRRLGAEATEAAFATGFRSSGQILILTGVGGSLAAMVKAVGLGDILTGYFSASTVAPLLLVWLVAAVLHMAIGSVTTAAITAAGILAPVAPSLDVAPVFVALAAGSGSLFAIHATSNTFWLLQTLLGQTTRGTLKTCTVTVSFASVVALAVVQALSVLS